MIRIVFGAVLITLGVFFMGMIFLGVALAPEDDDAMDAVIGGLIVSVPLIGVGVWLIRSGSSRKVSVRRRMRIRDLALDMLAEEGWIDTWEIAAKTRLAEAAVSRVIDEYRQAGVIPPLDDPGDSSPAPRSPAPAAPPPPPPPPIRRRCGQCGSENIVDRGALPGGDAHADLHCSYCGAKWPDT